MNNNFDVTILKNLSIRECIGLAKYIYPKYTWFYHHNAPDEDWDGHDVASGKWCTSTGYNQTLRIDYRADVNSEQPRILFMDSNGTTEIPDATLVATYLRLIGKLK